MNIKNRIQDAFSVAGWSSFGVVVGVLFSAVFAALISVFCLIALQFIPGPNIPALLFVGFIGGIASSMVLGGVIGGFGAFAGSAFIKAVTAESRDALCENKTSFTSTAAYMRDQFKKTGKDSMGFFQYKRKMFQNRATCVGSFAINSVFNPIKGTVLHPDRTCRKVQKKIINRFRRNEAEETRDLYREKRSPGT